MKRGLAFLLASILVAALSGCGESTQVVVYKQGKYQGKPDTRAWDNEPLATGPKWNKGDRGSWETQIKSRNLTQNEYARIGH